jgi:hypothetical protein
MADTATPAPPVLTASAPPLSLAPNALAASDLAASRSRHSSPREASGTTKVRWLLQDPGDKTFGSEVIHLYQEAMAQESIDWPPQLQLELSAAVEELYTLERKLNTDAINGLPKPPPRPLRDAKKLVRELLKKKPLSALHRLSRDIADCGRYREPGDNSWELDVEGMQALADMYQTTRDAPRDPDACPGMAAWVDTAIKTFTALATDAGYVLKGSPQ